jgi:large subunit ribosomal protein L35
MEVASPFTERLPQPRPLRAGTTMPKMKTKSAAKKRFKISAKGKLSHKHTFSRHNQEHKSRKRKRSMRKDQDVHSSDQKEVKRLLGTYFKRGR